MGNVVLSAANNDFYASLSKEDEEEEEELKEETLCYSCDHWSCHSVPQRALMSQVSHPSEQYFRDVLETVKRDLNEAMEDLENEDDANPFHAWVSQKFLDSDGSL